MENNDQSSELARLKTEELEHYAKNDYLKFLDLANKYKKTDFNYYCTFVLPIFNKYLNKYDKFKPEDEKISSHFNSKSLNPEKENLEPETKKHVLFISIIIILSLLLVVAFIFILNLSNTNTDMEIEKNKLNQDNEETMGRLARELKSKAELQEKLNNEKNARIKIENEKIEKERLEKESLGRNSFEALALVINNVPVLKAVTVGKHSSVSQAINTDYTLKIIPTVGGDYCYKWYYNEAPTNTYFEVKKIRDRIYNVYFRVGKSYQDGSYYVDLSNNAIEKGYDNFSKLAGF
ncbi:MAG TPA: hypothetical protein VIK14_08855 [Ignavibacteria bacterium]